MAYFRKGIRTVLEPEPFGMAGAIAGQFVVGDGTLVGQGATGLVPMGKGKLILNGKAFTAATFTGQVEIAQFSVRPRLYLLSKQTTVYGNSTALAQLPPKLILAGKAFTIIVPEFAHMGRSSLVLKGKSFSLITSSTPVMGKPKLILRGKPFHAGVIALTATIPVNVNLVPTAPEPAGPLVVGTLVLVPSAPQSYDLVPTEEEFR